VARAVPVFHRANIPVVACSSFGSMQGSLACCAPPFPFASPAMIIVTSKITGRVIHHYFSDSAKKVSDVYGWPGRPAQLQAPEPAESKKFSNGVPSAPLHVLQRLPLLAVGGTLPSIAFLPRAYRDRGGGTDWAIEPLFWRDRWIGRRNY